MTIRQRIISNINVVHQIELDEYEKTTLVQSILLLQDYLKKLQEVTITYFLPEERKNGRKYVSIAGGIFICTAANLEEIVAVDRIKKNILKS